MFDWFKKYLLKILRTIFTRRFIVRSLLMCTFFAILLIIGANHRIQSASKPFVHSEMSALPDLKVGLILGTTKRMRSGQLNAYFAYRIRAAVQLYRSGKIRHFLISGDHGKKEYNEPRDMMESLLEAGIPRSAITLDYAGFDTYDSMIRAKEVFGQDAFVVISQQFQNERAVYIARSFDIEAYGYNAKDVKKYGGIRTKAREYLARVKAVIEVLLKVEPTFLAERIEIP